MDPAKFSNQTEQTYRLQDLPLSQRPRELLERHKIRDVQDEVLLAIVLRSGTRGVNVLKLARQLLYEFGSLSQLAKASQEELIRPGIGKVKAQVLKAALELGRRLADEKLGPVTVIKSAADVVAVLREDVRVLREETFWVLLLNSKHHLLGKPIPVSRGLLDKALIHPREVFRPAIHASSARIILAHNHPSGDATPSQDDVKITKSLIEAGRILSIEVLDHVILARAGGIGGREYISLRESGLVDFGE